MTPIGMDEPFIASFLASGWFNTSSGRKELRITLEDPRHVTPIITRRGATRYILGTTRRNSIDVVAPVNPKPRRNLLR